MLLRPSKQILDSFRGRRVAIAGDLVADQFLEGTISRVSREAPVFIMRHDATETRPGGAANAAANVASLGGTPLLVGLMGRDAGGDHLREALSNSRVDCTHVLAAAGVQTTTKIRVLAGQQYAARQQVIRIDYENAAPASPEIQSRLIANLVEAAAAAEAIVISDYGCGAVSPMLFGQAKSIARGRNIPLVVDSRFRLEAFAGAAAATPNQDEVEQILGPGFIDADCERLRERLELESLLVTRGNKGMLLIEKNAEPLSIKAVGPTAPVDVTGAGDTVIAAFALGLAAGLSYADAASVANHAGGVVVMKRGTATANPDELLAFAREAEAAATKAS